MRIRSRALVVFGAASVFALLSGQARDTAGDGARGGALPHADAWDRVLRAHARDGGVDYRGLAADDARIRELDRFLGDVATMPDDAPLAVWLDAYNAIVVKEVTSRLPLRSVRDVPGFFDRMKHRVAGRERTLDDLENRVIRPRFRDARVHMALSCASASCPPLFGRALETVDLDATLDQLARAVVASDRFVARTDDGLRLSEIFFWYREDFVRDAGSVVGWLARHDRGGRLRGVSADATLERIPYDWRLNARSGARPTR